jgi:hypothetical protein
MPNIEILRKFEKSILLEAIQASNRMKIEREARVRLEPSSVEEISISQPA